MSSSLWDVIQQESDAWILMQKIKYQWGEFMPRRAAKVDGNQHEVVAALESEGYRVRSTAGIGDGFPDLCITHPDWTFVRLVEVKNGPRGRLTDKQRDFIADGWPVDVVSSTLEVLALVQKWRKE